MHTDFRGGCRVRKVVIVLVDGEFHKLCVIFMALGIYEETTCGDRLDTVGKSVDEESEKSEKLHCMNVEVKKRFNFLAEPTVPHLPWVVVGLPLCPRCREVRNRRFCKKRGMPPPAPTSAWPYLTPATPLPVYITMRAFGLSSDAVCFASISARRSAGVFAENTCQYMSLPVRRLTP